MCTFWNCSVTVNGNKEQLQNGSGIVPKRAHWENWITNVYNDRSASSSEQLLILSLCEIDKINVSTEHFCQSK